MKPIKHVCIVGAGSIGSLYAAHLARVADVSVLARRQEHADALNKHGLRVSGKSSHVARVRASLRVEDFNDVDLVIIATKTTDVEASAAKLHGYFSDALIMLVQNGLGCEEVVANYGDWPILSAVTFMAGTRHSDTEVDYEVERPTWLGPWAGGRASFDQARSVEKLLIEAGLVAEAFEDLLPAQWSKLIFNATINSISAATDLPFCRQFAETENLDSLGHLVFAMLEEGKAVAAASGVTLYTDPVDMVTEVVKQFGEGIEGGREPSMLVDVRQQQPTEIDAITGAIVKQADKVGVPVPLNATLYRLIKGRELGWTVKKTG
jgi:2-dehydropantoate 2-reductase